MRNIFLTAVLSPLALMLASCSASAAGDSSAAQLETPANASVTAAQLGTFAEPWAMAFIPGTPYALVTERKGRLKLWQDNGSARDVSGVPEVDYGGQGGLGDVVLAPDYAKSGMIYLSWVEAGAGNTRGAVIGRAKLVLDAAPRLEGLQVIWRQAPKVSGRGHFSHRITFAPDGHSMFVASGERQKFDPAQDMAVNLGKVLHLNIDGTAAAGNPFAAQGGVTAQIWSLGHRNILGLSFDTQGRLWVIEHGPRGGDELNLVKPGANYGWPIVSNGDHYDGGAIPRHSSRPDFAAPAISWNPVIGPGDMIFYRGDTFPQWHGQALIASMVYPGLVRVAIDGEAAREVERIPLSARIREIKQREDGSVWALTDGTSGRLLKLSPRQR